MNSVSAYDPKTHVAGHLLANLIVAVEEFLDTCQRKGASSTNPQLNLPPLLWRAGSKQHSTIMLNWGKVLL